MRYETADWSLNIPDGWIGEPDGDCTTFTNQNGVGAFQISGYWKDEEVTDDDLREFAEDARLQDVALAEFCGYRSSFNEDDVFWTKLWLRAGRQMLFVTYNCALGESEVEAATLNAMIESLRPAS